MVWFRIDDSFHAHPKIEQLPNGAIGLWVKAGSWSMKYLTDGVVPASVVRSLKGTRPQIDALVRSGMWVEIVNDSGRKSYAFRDWIDYQMTRSEVMEARAKQARIKRESRANQTRIKRESHTQKSDDQQGRENVHGGLLDPYPYPLPSRDTGRGVSTGLDAGARVAPSPESSSAPPATPGAYGTPDDPRCAAHKDLPRDQVPPCRACGDARRQFQAQAASAANARKAAIEACPWCDDRGLVTVAPAGPWAKSTAVRCDHTGPPPVQPEPAVGDFTPTTNAETRRALIEKNLGKEGPF